MILSLHAQHVKIKHKSWRLVYSLTATALLLGACSSVNINSSSTQPVTESTTTKPVNKSKQIAPLKSKDICDSTSSSVNPFDDVGDIINIYPPSTGPYPYFEFLEGPVWVNNEVDGGSLFFSDLVAPARIWKLTPPSTTPDLYLENSDSNGLAYDNNNHLIIADREDRRITRLDLDTKELIELIPADGKFKPNDVITRSDNNFYFTASKSGFFHVSADGKLNKPIKTVYSPNGIGLSLDETTLYVGDFTTKTITAFQLNNDGSVDGSSSKSFATTKGSKVDGMTTDCAGNIYVGTTAGVEVFNSSGKNLGILPTGRSSNTTFGGPDRKTLYVTTPKVLKAINLSIKGLPN